MIQNTDQVLAIVNEHGPGTRRQCPNTGTVFLIQRARKLPAGFALVLIAKI